MSKRRKKSKLNISDDHDNMDYSFDGDMYQAPKGKKPRGRDKRKAGNHKTAYWD